MESSPHWLPISALPTGVDECLLFIYLVSDFLAVRFSVSSGCARRCSVSTYATILVLPSSSFYTRIRVMPSLGPITCGYEGLGLCITKHHHFWYNELW